VLFVEHDMHMVRHISDWVIVMAEGRVVAEGPPETIMQNRAVVDAYLGAHHDTDLGTLTNQQVAQIHHEAEDEVPVEAAPTTRPAAGDDEQEDQR